MHTAYHVSEPDISHTYLTQKASHKSSANGQVLWYNLKGEKIAKEKKCEIKECQWVAEKFMKYGIKDCDPLIFREMRKQKLRGFI